MSHRLELVFGPPNPNTLIDQPASGRKKKPLTDIEIALKREETARKRKNLTEKKLEDEKVMSLLARSWPAAFLTCFNQGRDYKSTSEEAVTVQNKTERGSTG